MIVKICVIDCLYDQVMSAHYETRRNTFLRHFVVMVTGPIWVPVFIAWGLQGNRC